MEEIPILGVIVGKGQVKMEQEKIKAVKEWKTPAKIKDVESFLGFANFYRRFIHNFSHTARPLMSRSLTVDFILFFLLIFYFTFLSFFF